jgi:predicted secreted acid phosphatase
MVNTIIVDIDGTIADISKRLEYTEDKTGIKADNNKKNKEFWNLFLDGKLFHMDVPLIEARKKLWDYVKKGNNIFYVSGRRKESKPYTKLWLKKHKFPNGLVHHRKRGERSLKYKTFIFKKIKENNTVECVIGDSKRDDGGAAMANNIKFYHIKRYDWSNVIL